MANIYGHQIVLARRATNYKKHWFKFVACFVLNALILGFMTLNSTTSVGKYQMFKPRLINSFGSESNVFAPTWSKNNQKLAFYSDYGNTINIVNATGDKISTIRRSGAHFFGRSLGFIDQGTKIVARSTSSLNVSPSIDVYDVSSGKLIQSFYRPDLSLDYGSNTARLLTVSTNEDLIAVSIGTGISQKVYILKYSEEKFINFDEKVALLNGAVTSLAFSPDDNLLAISFAYKVVIFDIAGNKIKGEFSVLYHAQDGCCVSVISFNSDSTLLGISNSSFQDTKCDVICADSIACCDKPKYRSKIHLVNLITGDVTYVKNALSEPVLDISWNKLFNVIAFTVKDYLLLTDPESRIVKKITGAQLNDLSFSPNGQILAVCDQKSVNIYSIN